MKIPKIFKYREIDPTRGSIASNVLGMTKYLWVNTIFWAIIQLLNLYWVSRLGAEEIASVAIGGLAFMLLMTPIHGISIASLGLVGNFNRQDAVGLDRLVKQILTFTWITSVLLALFGFLFAPSLIKLLGAEPEVVSLAVGYLRICAIGGIFSFSFWPINDMLRATRDMFRPMLFMALVIALQGFFDYLFVLGNLGFPKMGVMGAGLSSTLSAAIGAMVGFWMLLSGKLFIKVDIKKWRDFKVQTKTLGEILKIAGFDTLEEMARRAIGMVMLAIIASFGTSALAAFAVGQRFFRYSSVLGLDLGKTTNITLANNLGTGNIKRAERSGWIICGIGTAILGFIGLAFFLFAGQIVGLFSQDQEILAAGINYFKITTLAGLGYAFFAAGTIFQRAFAGAKDTKTPMFVYWLTSGIQVGLAILLPHFLKLGINGVWIAILAGMIFHGLVLTILFKIGSWKPKIK